MFVFQTCISILELMTLYLQVLGDLLCIDKVIYVFGFRLILFSLFLKSSTTLIIFGFARK